MTNQVPPPLSSFLAIKYWPTWIGITFFCLLAYLPFSFRTFIGNCIGRCLFLIARERRYITNTNISLCFPELSTQEQHLLTRKVFVENSIGFLETFACWVRSPEYFKDKVRFQGTEFIDAALAKGRGLLLLGAHYSTLDLGGTLMSLRNPAAASYRPHKNPLFDAFIRHGRLRSCVKLFDRKDIRGSFKHLKSAQIFWYAPDQDYGESHSVYAPFFNHQAATITASSRYAKVNNSPVIILRQHRLHKEKAYEVEFIPAPSEFPSGDDTKDATLINKALEDAIRVHPEQYLWMHKRFKTQARGKLDSPYINIKLSNRKISSTAYAELLSEAIEIETLSAQEKVLQLTDGMLIRTFTSTKHAKTFYQQAQTLRLKGINSVVVDRIQRVPKLKIIAVIFYPTPGESLTDLFSGPKEKFPSLKLASFFANLHKHGIQIQNIRTDKIIFSDGRFGILNPEEIKITPSSLSNMERCNNILDLLSQLQLTRSELMNFCHYYVIESGLQENLNFMKKFSKVRDLCFNSSNHSGTNV